MAIEEKIRSLHCGLQAGLGFQEIDGQRLLPLQHVPFELQHIVLHWINALPEDLLVELVVDGDKFTETGWSAFVSWMTHTLDAAQRKPDFAASAQTLVIAQRD
ncbi:MAG: hypothetical protein ABI575_10030 [Oxalobacteraceae bacterium]